LCVLTHFIDSWPDEAAGPRVPKANGIDARQSPYALQKICPERHDAVLVIHTKKNGEISEAASAKSREELELLRKQSNEIDSWASPFKAIVSVLVLKKGWDVRNVTTIVGRRAYVAASNLARTVNSR
jgi:hypothetical protein